jgi:hypothetical protein
MTERASAHGRRKRTDRRRGAEHAKRPGAGLEDVAGIDRQERSNAAEEHCEKIKRNCTEQNGPASNIDKPGKQRLQTERLARLAPLFGGQQREESARDGENDGARRINDHRPQAVEESAKRGSADDRGLLRTDGGGHRTRQKERRNEPGQKGMDGRHLECARGAEDAQNRQHGFAGKPMVGAAESKNKGAYCFHRLRRGSNDTPVEAIGDLADDDREHQDRQKLHHADQAEIEWIVRKIVELPTDGHRLHHVGAIGERARAPEQHEGAVPYEARLNHALQRDGEQRIDQSAVEDDRLFGECRCPSRLVNDDLILIAAARE